MLSQKLFDIDTVLCFFSIISFERINHSGNRLLTLFWWPHKVEDADDIQNVPATVSSGAEVKEEKSSDRDSHSEDKGTTSDKLSTSELPPHIVIGMPALSPTMVRKYGLGYEINMSGFFAEGWILLIPAKFNYLFQYIFVQNQGNIFKWRKKEGDKVGLFG